MKNLSSGGEGAWATSPPPQTGEKLSEKCSILHKIGLKYYFSLIFLKTAHSVLLYYYIAIKQNSNPKSVDLHLYFGRKNFGLAPQWFRWAPALLSSSNCRKFLKPEIQSNSFTRWKICYNTMKSIYWWLWQSTYGLLLQQQWLWCRSTLFRTSLSMAFDLYPRRKGQTFFNILTAIMDGNSILLPNSTLSSPNAPLKVLNTLLIFDKFVKEWSKRCFREKG